MESAACGILAAENLIRHLKGDAPLVLPSITMLGALLEYITDERVENFQPMGANFGIIPPLETRIRDKAERYTALSNRSLEWYDRNIG
jgi:methylenetetrahydrofolate--tRNA-(uracil-5-)-methyltransferase